MLLLTTPGCGRTATRSDSDTTVKTDTVAESSPFHADNDIAMVIGSLTDALRVGEPFDSAAYSYTGLLTDGTGAPLYFDAHGNPGIWSITIENPATAVIANTSDGDLVANDVAAYLISCLHIPSDSVRHTHDRRFEYETYPVDNGTMTFAAPTSSAGMKGCRITITVAK